MLLPSASFPACQRRNREKNCSHHADVAGGNECCPSLERNVIDELNIAKTKPRLYADYLKQYRKLYKGSYMYVAGGRVRIATSGGVGAVDEATRFLRKQKPLASLVPSWGLAEAADDLVEDQGPTGETGHYGRSSGSMREPIEPHGQWRGGIGENIGYGFRDPRCVIQLIVDDGVRDRGTGPTSLTRHSGGQRRHAAIMPTTAQCA